MRNTLILAGVLIFSLVLIAAALVVRSANPPPAALPSRMATAVWPNPTATPIPTATAVLTATFFPTAAPAPAVPPAPPYSAAVNGIPLENIIVLPPDVLANSRAIFRQGQTVGRNPRAFSKVGDSTIENPYFLARFDGGPYNLGEYAYLQGVIDHFAGSYGRSSAAVRTGLHSWTAVDPMWADKTVCFANESPIACEIRLHNPSLILIRLGANDVGVPAAYDGSIRQLVETAIGSGVIPILGTKADRHEGSNINNDILRQIAADYQIPLWEFDLVAATLPGRGLDVDDVHMNTFHAHDYTSPTAFQRGHSVHNLTALITLDLLWRQVIQEEIGD